MSGIGFFELVILFMIGLVVLGPKRLPKVANQLGSWIGQARRMTRAMKRQLEEELDLDEDLKNFRDLKDGLREDLTIGPAAAHVPRDDDTYSPRHDEPDAAVARAQPGTAEDRRDPEEIDDDSGGEQDGDDDEPEKPA